MGDQLKEKWIEMAVREVSTQCKLALTALEMTLSAANTDAAFSSIQAFLSHCANVSKMLQAEREPRPILNFESEWRFIFRWLRRLAIIKSQPRIGDELGIEKSAMVHNEGRAFRNNLEHYDHRLFEWLGKYGTSTNIGDFNVMPKAMIKVPNLIYIRHIDRDALTFTFIDRDLDLGVLESELQHIKSVADEYIARRNVLRAKQQL